MPRTMHRETHLLRPLLPSGRHTLKPSIPYGLSIFPTCEYPDVIIGATGRDVPRNCGVASEATRCTDALSKFPPKVDKWEGLLISLMFECNSRRSV